MTQPVTIPSLPVIPVSGSRPAAPVADNGHQHPPLGPNEHVPTPANYSFDDLLRGLNPLHHLPVVGTIYRAITGETVPAPERIVVSAVAGAFFGGPLGVLGTIVSTLAEEFIRMGPDPTSPRFDDPESGAKNAAAAAAAWADTSRGSG